MLLVLGAAATVLSVQPPGHQGTAFILPLNINSERLPSPREGATRIRPERPHHAPKAKRRCRAPQATCAKHGCAYNWAHR
jgi:hypothetical protein